MATHEEPVLERVHLVVPAAMWAETDGTFTNYQRRVQRFRRAFAGPGSSTPRWELTARVLKRLGAPFAAGSTREVFGLLAKGVADYAGLDHRSVGATGRALKQGPDDVATQEARA
jgi:predicted molibdopterin-dependent oxidoreductase YjgC